MDMRAAAVEAATLTHDTGANPYLRREAKRASRDGNLLQQSATDGNVNDELDGGISQDGSEAASRRVMRPSFLMA